MSIKHKYIKSNKIWISLYIVSCRDKFAFNACIQVWAVEMKESSNPIHSLATAVLRWLQYYSGKIKKCAFPFQSPTTTSSRSLRSSSITPVFWSVPWMCPWGWRLPGTGPAECPASWAGRCGETHKGGIRWCLVGYRINCSGEAYI